MNLLLLLAGFVPLILGANVLVDSASSLARRLKISNLVIGLTVVGFGTSAPELIVNIFASAEGNSSIPLGNVVGSNIFNVLFILGLSALVRPLAVKKSTTWAEIPLAILAAGAVLIMASDVSLDGEDLGAITRSEGIVLLLFFGIFMAYTINLTKQSNEADELRIKEMPLARAILFVVLGLAMLVLGGKLIVDNAVAFATELGVDQRIIALTIIAAGTSLPELATSIVAARKGQVDIAIGNVVGSNIFNVFFILGLSATINNVAVSAGSFVDLWVHLATMILLFLFVFTGKGRTINRLEGSLFVTAFVGYTVFLIVSG